MTISERILKVLKDRNMTQVEFAKQVGIATSTISEWKKRKTNPTADKIMDICSVLQITPEQLLTGKGIEDEEEIDGLCGGFEENQTVSLAEDIRDKVYWIRGKQVMLDADLAYIYGYEVKNLNRQVKRNIGRFPEDLMFQLTQTEYTCKKEYGN